MESKIRDGVYKSPPLVPLLSHTKPSPPLSVLFV